MYIVPLIPTSYLGQHPMTLSNSLSWPCTRHGYTYFPSCGNHPTPIFINLCVSTLIRSFIHPVTLSTYRVLSVSVTKEPSYLHWVIEEVLWCDRLRSWHSTFRFTSLLLQSCEILFSSWRVSVSERVEMRENIQKGKGRKSYRCQRYMVWWPLHIHQDTKRVSKTRLDTFYQVDGQIWNHSRNPINVYIQLCRWR